MAHQKSRRRWFSYSVRTLLIAMTIFCVWLGVQVNRAHRQRDLLAAIEKAGGRATYDYQYRRVEFSTFGAKQPEPPGPAWLRKLIGDEYFIRINGAAFWDADANDNAARIFQGQTGIQDLGFESMTDEGNQITDAGLKSLRELTSLKELNVQFAEKITDDGLKYLGELENLESLALNFSSQISDAGLKHLKKLSKLSFLMLNGTQVTEAGVAELQRALPQCTIHFQD